MPQENKGSKRYLTPREVSERYGRSISVGTLANWRTMGVSPPYIKLGGKIVYEEEALIEWERRRTCNGTFMYKR